MEWNLLIWWIFSFFFKIDGIYVDLLENVEAYTGFNGDSAKKIWSSIYNENCFLNEESPLEESCTEKKVFFKLISGIFLSQTHSFFILLFSILFYLFIFNSFSFFEKFFFCQKECMHQFQLIFPQDIMIKTQNLGYLHFSFDYIYDYFFFFCLNK